MKKGLILIIIIIVALLAAYFSFFYAKSCSNVACFNDALGKCKRAVYLNDAEDATWLYNIRGEENGKCEVEVKMLTLKQGGVEMSILEGKDMLCSLPLGSIAVPQENLARCHGLLKEEMQGIIIKRLHNYIVDNLGEIGEELKSGL